MYLKLLVIIDSGINLALETCLHPLQSNAVEFLSSFSLGSSAEKSAPNLGDPERADDKRKEKSFGAICELPPPFTS